MKAREVIASEIGSYNPDYESKQDAAERMIGLLAKAGFVILPKEPNEGELENIRMAIFDNFADDYAPAHCSQSYPDTNTAIAVRRAMISHAEGEKG